MIISTLPRELESTEHLGALISAQLAQGVDPNNLTPAALRSLDEQIIAETESLGWRIFTSMLVLSRFQIWESQPGGIELYARLGKSLHKFAKVMQRQTPPPVDSRIHQHKRDTVRELRLASKVVRSQLAGLRKKASSAKVLGQFRQAIAEGSFPYLTANLDSWNQFFTDKSEFIQSALDAPRFPAANVYDAWLAHSTGYDQETLRQKITLKQ